MIWGNFQTKKFNEIKSNKLNMYHLKKEAFSLAKRKKNGVKWTIEFVAWRYLV